MRAGADGTGELSAADGGRWICTAEAGCPVVARLPADDDGTVCGPASADLDHDQRNGPVPGAGGAPCSRRDSRRPNQSSARARRPSTSSSTTSCPRTRIRPSCIRRAADPRERLGLDAEARGDDVLRRREVDLRGSRDVAGHLLDQVAGEAGDRGVQGQLLDLVHLLAKPVAHARQHPEAGIHRLAQHAAHHLAVECEQHARLNRLGAHRIAARLHEHHRLREHLPPAGRFR